MKANKEPHGCVVLLILTSIIVAAFAISESTPYIGINYWQTTVEAFREKDVEQDFSMDTLVRSSNNKILYDPQKDNEKSTVMINLHDVERIGKYLIFSCFTTFPFTSLIWLHAQLPF